MRRVIAFCCAALIWNAFAPRPADACTNLIVTKGASADGSTMITYNADSHELYGELVLIPGGTFQPGATREIIEGDSGKFLGRIPQAPVTYWVVGNISEHQVSTGETTFTGREELKPDPPIGIDYVSLDEHRHGAREDRARGDQGHDRPRRRVRVRLHRRVHLGCRPQRGLDLRDHRQGQGGQGRGVGCAPRAGRLHLGARQPGAHPAVPAQRPRQLPVLQGRHLVRPRRRGGSRARTRSSPSPTPTRRSTSARCAPASRGCGACSAAPRPPRTSRSTT